MVVSRATGMARSTIGIGLKELRSRDNPCDLVHVRHRGSGRKKHEVTHPRLVEELEKLINPATRGDPESRLCWTSKSLRKLAHEIVERLDVWVCATTVGRILKERGYSLQAPNKTTEGKQHPDRDAQLEYISEKADRCIKHGVPVVSVDTKKKELVGNLKNGGREWQPNGGPELVDIHDFPDQAIGKAIPYGVYDIGDNSAYVNVGVSHDTAAFAVASIETWWKLMGSVRYPDAAEILITADAGGSNGYRRRLWKLELQRFADKYGIVVHVSHLPPGTSKWNKIEHRLFSYISLNWRGRPLRTYETVVKLISNTTTAAGLIVTAQMDEKDYPLGIEITEQQMRTIRMHADKFHGEWNYTISPRITESC
jgi:transposase